MPQSPLNSTSKYHFISKLVRANEQAIYEALCHAALRPIRFPKEMEEQICHLREAYSHEQSEHVKPILQNAIEVKLDELKQTFMELCHSYQREDEWPSDFLYFLSEQLAISIKASKYVNVALDHGKVYWRVMKDNKVVYDRQAAKSKAPITYTQSNSFNLTWDQFRQFKSVGKRYGNVKITERVFVDAFEDAKKDQAKAVWDELKKKGFLDEKDRLSTAWRLQSNISCKMDSIVDVKKPYIIDKDRLKSVLKKLRGSSRKSKMISLTDYLTECRRQFPGVSDEKHAAIWEALQKAGAVNEVLGQGKYAVKLIFSSKDVLNPYHITYSEVANTLFSLANMSDHAETILKGRESLFRPEKNKKNWSSQSMLSNVKEGSSTQLWDVSTYDDLNKHRDSDEEVNKYGGEILNYDHIPSSCALDSLLKDKIKDTEEQIKAHQCQIQELEKKRQTKSIQEAIEAHQCEMEDKKMEVKKMKKEVREKRLSFALAIPAKLHTQGATFMVRQRRQSHIQPVVDEFKAYLALLASRPGDFGFKGVECQFLFISAFRHLYRTQIKTDPIPDYVGRAPQAFFSEMLSVPDIDQLMVQELKRVARSVV